MPALLMVIQPILLRVVTHPAVKKLIIELLEKLVKTTDNSIDDAVLATVKELMFKPEA